ncbi:unnamed protein product [Amoebophrya sp. A120]|nr:unnamed protein product [Amoebophrya sp. A120]|eukprot:GSA120T00018884001.1
MTTEEGLGGATPSAFPEPLSVVDVVATEDVTITEDRPIEGELTQAAVSDTEKPASENPASEMPTDAAGALGFCKENQAQFLSGITVALAMIPEAVAFSFVAKVEPPVALTAAWIMCFFTAVAGGRPGMISGATGSMAVIMTSIVTDEGVEYLFWAVMFCGLFQILLGFAGIHKALSLVTFPVKIGFLNGLALVIGKAQLESFLIPHGETTEKTEHLEIVDFVLATSNYVKADKLIVMLVLSFIALGINFLPEKFQKYPLALISIVFVTVLEHACVRTFILPDEGTTLVEDMANLKGNFLEVVFSKYDMPNPFNDGGALASTILTAVYLCVIGLTESLMTLEKIDEMLPDSPPGDARREVLAQGGGNLICGFFGSMGGCAMIGQAMINVRNGGTKRIAGMTAGVGTLLIMVAISPVIGKIPVGSLVGVMWCVSYHTWEKKTHILFYEAFTGKPWKPIEVYVVSEEAVTPAVESPATTEGGNRNQLLPPGGDNVVRVISVSKEALAQADVGRSGSKDPPPADDSFGQPPRSQPSKETVGSKGSEISSYSAGGTRVVRKRSKGHYHHGVAGEQSPAAKREDIVSHLDNVVVTPAALRDRSRLSKEEAEDVQLGLAELSRFDCFIVVVVTIGTLITNLAIAVAAGIVMSKLNSLYLQKYGDDKPAPADASTKPAVGTPVAQDPESLAPN